MKGILDLISEDKWIIRFEYQDGPLTLTSSVPLSRFNRIMHKGELYIGANVDFKLAKENDFVSHCKCSSEEYDNCEHFVRSGINECINHDIVEIEVGKIDNIEPKPEPINQTFDRKIVQELLIEVKNRFGVTTPDNYISDFQIIEWFNRNYPIK
jgi:hypothetical protein